MEVSSLSTEGIGSNHCLGLEAVSADWTTQFDLTQRRHGTLSSLLDNGRGNFCAIFNFNCGTISFFVESRVEKLLLKNFSQRIFSHPLSAPRSTQYHKPGC
ncbi:MAG TPA: hypothetical protein VF042_13135 [Gemmatimonadaceae bacterium]